MRKYIMMEQVSTIVVIKGDAMIAGSRCSCFAKIGSMQPTILATTIVPISEAATTIAISAMHQIDPYAVGRCQHNSYDQGYAEFLPHDGEAI